MSSKSEKDRAKQIQERCQNILMQMLKDEDNKYCVDCDAKGPRWASWNLGIFLCIRCAGIHRNLGVHISKVKSVNLDSWTPEQVVSLQQMGNSRARAVYEANLPDSFRRPQNDSSLEAFIRAKYETKKYIAKEWVPPSPPKVNWDKEIDEEMDRQKRKKKSTTVSTVGPLPPPSTADKKYNKSDVIPSIPKPKASVSPKLGRSPATQPDPAPTKPSNGAADLLGLDTSKTEPDIFSSFFSAPQEPKNQDFAEVKAEAKPDLKLEEENFFKQAAPSEKEKSKLTKDSILALYSQTPATNLSSTQYNNQQQGFYNTPFQAAFNSQNANQNGMQNFSQFSGNQSNQFAGQTNNQFAVTQPSNQFAVTQPSNQFAVTQPSNQFSVTQPSNQFAVSQQSNQFAASQPSNQFAVTQPSNQFAVSQPNNQFQQYSGTQSFPNAFQNQAIPNQAISNQLFNVGQPTAPQTQLNQQFGNMNLGQFPNTFAQPNVNVASNISWQ